MNYDELEAGPEMDRLVAEAMGWRVNSNGVTPDYWMEEDGACPGDVSTEDDYGNYESWCPSIKTDQAIMFATDKSACFVLFSPHTKDEGWLCSAQGCGHVGGTPGKAATPSLAICRAVLKMLAKDKS